MDNRPIIYVAHPVSGDARANALRCTAWVRWLTLHDPTRIYVAPWVAEVLAFEDDFPPGGKAGVLGADLAVLRRFDGIILTGGRISEGMGIEDEVGRTLPQGSTDLSMYETPWDAEAADVILEPHITENHG